MFIVAVQLVVIVVIGMFVITQVILPAWNELPLFPMFRKTTEHLKDDLNEAHQELVDMHLANEINKVRDQVAKEAAKNQRTSKEK